MPSSVSPESRDSLPGRFCLRVSHEVVVTLFREPVTIWKAGWGPTCFHDREEASFPHWLLAGDLSSLPWPCVLRTWQLASPRATVLEGAPKMEAAAFYNLTSEVTITSALFCWSHRPTLVRCGRGIHRGGGTRSWGSLGITLKIRYHAQSADSDLVPTCAPGAINWELVTQCFRPWGAHCLVGAHLIKTPCVPWATTLILMRFTSVHSSLLFNRPQVDPLFAQMKFWFAFFKSPPQ